MKLAVNTLVVWGLETDEPIVERVLWIEDDGSRCIMIRCGTDRGLPSLRTCAEIETALSNDEARALDTDPFEEVLRTDSEISESDARRRDEAWDLIKPLVEKDNERLALLPRYRGELIAARAHETGHTKMVIYRALRRYWQGGMRKNALLPRYVNSGGRGKSRLDGAQNGPKRGRPSYTEQATGQRTGVNVDADIARRFELGIIEFFESEEKRSLREAYDMTVAKHFRGGFELRDGALVPILLPSEQIPTLDQFRYWYKKRRSPRREIIARHGRRRFNLSHREVLGDSTRMAFGPGSVYQIDATVGDIYLVSSLDRSRIIGRPVIYLVVDVFSRLIAGFSVALEGPSWLGAMLALDNAATDKVAFCAEYGVTIDAMQWPSACLPESILADRGEFEGYQADNLVNALNVAVANTPPYRADWKGIVERYFRLANDRFIRWMPGAVVKPRERGGADYRLDAALTLREFRMLMIHLVVEHNVNHRMDWYRLDEFMIAGHVKRYPVDLWAWGIENRSGHLRTVPRDVLRIHLLPSTSASVTHRGIHVNKLFYTCDLAVREQWFVKARGSSWKVPVAYDPRSSDAVYLRLPDGKTVEPCHLVEAESTFRGRDLYDVIDYFNLETQAKNGDRLRQMQSRAELRAKQEHVAAQAKAATDSARRERGEQSNRARTSGIRANRRDERNRERDEGAWLSEVPSRASHSANVIPIAGPKSAVDSDDDYVPAPDDVDRIRTIREEVWKSDER